MAEKERRCIKCKTRFTHSTSSLCSDCLKKKFSIIRQLQIDHIGKHTINKILKEEGYIKC